MNRKIIISMVLLACLAFLPITSTADYPTGTLGYADEIAVGEKFEWTVTKLDLSGDFATYTDDFYIGDKELSQDSKIKVVVLEDPDNASGVWYDIYVNNVKTSDSSMGFLLGYGLYYAFGGFFINPVTYTNTTGTYNIYEQLIEELVDDNYNNGDSITTTYGGYTYEYGYSEIVEFKLQEDVFSILMYDYAYISIEGNGYEESMSMEMRIETTTNIRTGLLGRMEVLIDYDMATSYSGKIHFIIDSPYAGDGRTIVPYTWSFSLLGLSAMAIALVIVKRKRK